MRTFKDEQGNEWRAKVAKEDTQRHHSIWYLSFEGADGESYPLPEVRWQTGPTGERTLRTMSEFELRRRLKSALSRNATV